PWRHVAARLDGCQPFLQIFPERLPARLDVDAGAQLVQCADPPAPCLLQRVERAPLLASLAVRATRQLDHGDIARALRAASPRDAGLDALDRDLTHRLPY